MSKKSNSSNSENSCPKKRCRKVKRCKSHKCTKPRKVCCPEPVQNNLTLRAVAAPVFPNNVFQSVTGYSILTDGGLGGYFNTASGVFTALTAGTYLFMGNIQFQLQVPSTAPSTVSVDGDRMIRFVRGNGGEPTFLGQYHFVAPDSLVSTRTAFVVSGQMRFEDPISATIELFMNAGDVVVLKAYQNNNTFLNPVPASQPVLTGGANQIAFTELAVIKLANSQKHCWNGLTPLPLLFTGPLGPN